MDKVNNTIDTSWKIDSEAVKNYGILTKNNKFVLSWGLNYYVNRLKKIRFMGKNSILLDAGCGVGHWSVASALLNKSIKAVDIQEKYLKIGKLIAKKYRLQNIEFKKARTERLPYPDEYFDFILCYSVWMYTDKEKSLKEFCRVLKPGGRIYLGGLDGFGWLLNLFLRGLKKFDRREIGMALAAIKNGNYITEASARNLLLRNDFIPIEFCADGLAGNKKIKVEPSYKIAKKWGFWNVFGALAIKYKKIKSIDNGKPDEN